MDSSLYFDILDSYRETNYNDISTDPKTNLFQNNIKDDSSEISETSISDIEKQLDYSDLDIILNMNSPIKLEINKSKYDESIYNIFSKEVLTEEPNEWKNTVKIAKKRIQNKEYIVRLLQIRRRELQKQYNKKLRASKSKIQKSKIQKKKY